MAIDLQATILRHMWQVYESPARFKVVAAGRRAAKSRTALTCAWCGHGPIDPVTNKHKNLGMFEGGQIAWLAPDYKQADAIWRKEIRPRLTGVPGFDVHKSDRIVTGPNGGLLEIRTNENIDALRGNKYHGVVVDEAAYLDLEYAWDEVISKCLIDYAGWLLIPSTTNAGNDGNSEKRLPSYFNLLVAALTGNATYDDTGVELPKVEPGLWAYFHARTKDNPILPAAEIEREYAQYDAESPVRQQELDALLIKAGGGLAFPEWDGQVHVIPTRRVNPGDWEYYATLDWGYRQGAYQVWGVDHEGNYEMVWEFYEDFKHLHAREAAQRIFRESRLIPLPQAIYHDDQMSADTGVAGGMKLIDEWNEGMASMFPNAEHMPICYPSAKEGQGRKTYRQTKKNIMHRFLKWQPIYDEKGRLQPWGQPKLHVQAHCKGFIREMAALPLAPHDPEDVDTEAPDHAYDAACFLLVGRPEAPERVAIPPSYDHFSIQRLKKRQRTYESDMTQPDEDLVASGFGPMDGYKGPHGDDMIQVDG